MRALGIVCEYNPFHSGHLYQLRACRERLGEDTAVVCAMSGDFVQRGEAAVFDKFARAEAACRCGADLVVELPLPWCLSSAEGFASGAVSMLAALGVSHLGFGSESGDAGALGELADFLLDGAAQERIRVLLAADASLSFARARQRAAEEALGGKADLLTSPNDILAVEYLKAIRRLGADITPMTVRRSGAGHDSAGEGEHRSAMFLRGMLLRGESIEGFVPAEALAVYRTESAAGRMTDPEKLEIALLSRLYQLRPGDFDVLPDAAGGAGRRLYKAIREEATPERIVQAAAGKRWTAARMRRMLLCAALGVCADAARGLPPYIRVLAANEKGRRLLRERAENAAMPPVVKPASVRTLGPDCAALFSLGAGAHDLYLLGCSESAARKAEEDWRRKPFLV